MKIIVAIKGGSGSGNFGHSGRPGLVGGSGGGAPSGGKITASEPIRGGTVTQSDLSWRAEDTIKGQVIIKHSSAVEPDESQLKGFIARRLPRLLFFGNPDEGIQEMKISNIERGAGYTSVKVDITPTDEQGADWVEHESYGEAYYGNVGEAIHGEG